MSVLYEWCMKEKGISRKCFSKFPHFFNHVGDAGWMAENGEFQILQSFLFHSEKTWVWMGKNVQILSEISEEKYSSDFHWNFSHQKTSYRRDYIFTSQIIKRVNCSLNYYKGDTADEYTEDLKIYW